MTINVIPAAPNPNKSDRWAVKIALLFMGMTLLPYLLGWLLAGDRFYTAFHYPADDFCHYASWMRQAEQGHFFFDNRFTTDAQPRKTIHLFFWLLGTIQRLTHLSTPFVMHSARFVFGVLAILAFYKLARKLLSEDGARWALKLFLFSSGFGWLMLFTLGFSPTFDQWMSVGWNAPADLWQPELIAFTSFYFNPLFAVSIWIFLELLNAILEAQTDSKAVFKGILFALLLANIHTYDLVTITAALVGLLGMKLVQREVDWKWVSRAVLIMMGALPAILWFVYVMRVDPVFQSRAGTETFSPPFYWYLGGLGPLILLAVAGAIQAFRQPNLEAFKPNAKALLPAWAVLGFCIPYLPALFQRKLWMGEQWPLVLLSAGFLSHRFQRLKPQSRQALALLVILGLSLTNLVWVRRDLQFLRDNVSLTGLHGPYLAPEQKQVLDWFQANTKPDEAVFASPEFACYFPAFPGNRVYAGHWSETPAFPERFKRILAVLVERGDVSSEEKAQIVRESGCRYAVNRKITMGDPTSYTDLSSLGEVVYENAAFRVYRLKE